MSFYPNELSFTVERDWGKLQLMPFSVATQSQILRMVHDEPLSNCANQRTLMTIIYYTKKLQAKVVGFHLPNGIGGYERKISAFAVLVHVNGVWSILFYCSPMDNHNKAFAALLAHYIFVNNKRQSNDVPFLYIPSLGTDRQKNKLHGFMQWHKSVPKTATEREQRKMLAQLTLRYHENEHMERIVGKYLSTHKNRISKLAKATAADKGFGQRANICTNYGSCNVNRISQ